MLFLGLWDRATAKLSDTESCDLVCFSLAGKGDIALATRRYGVCLSYVHCWSKTEGWPEAVSRSFRLWRVARSLSARHLIAFKTWMGSEISSAFGTKLH